MLANNLLCLLAVLAAGAFAAGLDLSKASIAAPAGAGQVERQAVLLLVEEIEARTQIRLAEGASGTPVIRLTRRNAGPPEGYRLQVSESGVAIEGNDARGVLYGAGHLLRVLTMSRQKVLAPAGFRIETAPKYALRGHQLGYRPKTNSYDAWTLPMWRQYIRDQAVFGANAIELIPPRSDDDDDSPHFPKPPIEMMIGMSQAIADFGMEVWIWYPAMDKDYGDPATVEFALKEWGEVFRKLPRVDHVFVPGGDPGHTDPKHLMPLLEKQTANLRRYHPKAKMWVAPQGFSQEWMNTFLAAMQKEPAWLEGIVFGPQVRMSLKDLRAAIPAKYPIRHYPDITHTIRAQYGVPDWDVAYALTLGREPVNPRPVDQAAIFKLLQPMTNGFLTYSEGCNDDVNKIIWSALGWNPEADLHQVLREYGNYFISSAMADSFAQGLFALERNWRGPLLANTGVETTLRQFQEMERRATPRDKLNWRFQQALYRANYDAYVRARLLHETSAEDRAMEQLRQHGVAALDAAERILDEATLHKPAASLRARTFELAEALFQSVRMQLSVPKYQAIAVGRGANLDAIDQPLNNAPWLKGRFAAIRATHDIRQQSALLHEILDWTNPGPGGFYDDLGHPAGQSHLVRDKRYAEDPARLESPLAGFAINPDSPIAPWRMSWLNHAEALNDAAFSLRYQHLDPAARYKLRVTYAGENSQVTIKCTAEGQLIHDFLQRPRPVKPLEFAVPPSTTADGTLTLTWERPKGLGGNGRGAQVSEVWLVRE